MSTNSCDKAIVSKRNILCFHACQISALNNNIFKGLNKFKQINFFHEGCGINTFRCGNSTVKPSTQLCVCSLLSALKILCHSVSVPLLDKSFINCTLVSWPSRHQQSNMSSYTQEQVKDLWDFFDEDKSGKIPCAELKNLFVKLGSDSETAAMKAEVSFTFTASVPILIFLFRLITWTKPCKRRIKIIAHSSNFDFPIKHSNYFNKWQEDFLSWFRIT